MAISDKLTRINQAKNDIKNALGTTDNKLEDYSNLAIKYVSNQPYSTSDGIIDDAKGLPINQFTLFGKAEQDGTPTPTNPVNINVVSGTVTINQTNEDGTKTKTYQIDLKDNFLAKIGDITDKLIISKLGKVSIQKNVNKIDSYNGESITTNYISTTGELTTGATIYYIVDNQTIELDDTEQIVLFDGKNIFTSDSNIEIEYIDNAKSTQTKSITITENGTQIVSADEDKSLSSVKITTNVSGGGVDDYFQTIKMDSTTTSTVGQWYKLIQKIPALEVTPYSSLNLYYLYNNFKGTEIDLSKLNTTGVSRFDYLFQSCTNLTSLDVSQFDTSSATNMTSMFNGCSSLTSLDLSNFNCSSVTSMNNIFSGCTNLVTLVLPEITFSSSATPNFFMNCNKLVNVNWEKLKFDNCLSFENMFEYCTNLTKIDLSNTTIKAITTFSYTFGYCSNLTTVDFGSNFNITNSIITRYMFRNCSKLTSVDLSFLNCSISNCAGMFQGCSSLQNLILSNADFTSATSYTNVLSSVPKDCYILAKDESNKDWLNSKGGGSFTNLHYVGEE